VRSSLGRPSALTDTQVKEIVEKRSERASLRQLASQYGVSRAAIQRAQKKSTASG